MTIESIWMVVVGISAPIAGVVAFYYQLKGIKKLDLENEKLHLEIRKLKDENQRLSNAIKIPSEEEVIKYSSRPNYARPNILEGRKVVGVEKYQSPVRRFANIDWGSLFIALLIVGFIGYLFYDIYRVGLWVLNLF